ncbi:copper ion binding protein, partial [Thioclava sp. BHET1]
MAEPLTARFDVEGMSCAACAGRVERAVKAVPGVIAANVNLATHSLSAEYAGDAAPAGIAAAVTKAGYGLAERESRLEIEGMSCASCVGRIERALKAVPGVTGADVNLASGGAVVRYYAGALEKGDLIRAVARAGYAASAQAGAEAEAPRDRFVAEAAAQKRHFAIALVLALPVFLLAMGSHFLPGVHHLIDRTMGERMSWIVQFVLTSAVLIWPGRQFLTHGFPALWRRAPDMNSLVALGATAAWAYSTVATFLPGVMPAGAVDVYFEAAAVIVA